MDGPRANQEAQALVRLWLGLRLCTDRGNFCIAYACDTRRVSCAGPGRTPGVHPRLAGHTAHGTRQARPNEVRKRCECILRPIVVSELGGVVERTDFRGKKNQASKEKERELSKTAWT